MNVRLRPTKKVLAVLAAVALVSIGLGAVVFRVQSAKRAESVAELAAKRKEADEIEAAAKQLPSSEAKLGEMRYSMSFLRPAEPNDYQPSLVLEVSGLAQRSGVDLTSLSMSEGMGAQQSPIAKTGQKVAPHKFMTVDMILEGSFHDITSFLYRLMGVSKIVSVDALQLQPATEGAFDGVRATLKMTAYVVKDIKPEMAAAAAKLKEIIDAEQKHKNAQQAFADLAGLNAAGLIPLKEGDEHEGYLFTTEKSATSKDAYKILATPKDTKDTKLHTLSVDQTKKITDETDKVPYE